MNGELAKILVADDDDLVRTTVSKILEMFGHTVTSVTDGEYVCEVLDDSYDVVLLDINMPGMDGFETIAAMAKLELDIPVIFLTGAGSMDYAVKAINLGAYDFLTKPIEDRSLLTVHHHYCLFRLLMGTYQCCIIPKRQSTYYKKTIRIHRNTTICQCSSGKVASVSGT